MTDPDLRFYTGKGKADPQLSPYGAPWHQLPSQGSQITVEMEGRCASTTPGASVLAGRRTTKILVSCADGLTNELRLTRL